MECYDGGFAFVNSQIPPNLSNIPKDTPYKTVIRNLIGSIKDVTVGVVGDFKGSTPKNITLNGNTMDVLRDLTGGGFFIDNGIGYALTNSEYSIKLGPPSVINKDSGLLNTPILENNLLRFDIEFEPNLVIGSAVMIDSTTLDTSVTSNFNGTYKLTSVKHRGMISETVCGEVVTTGEFFFLNTPRPVA
jgi:hypothetical protein